MIKFLLTLILACPFSVFAADQWNIEIVDSSGDVGQDSSIAMDNDDHPHISYFEYISAASGNLKYAEWTGSDWAIETVDTTGNVGRYTSIALDGQGYAHISYYYASSGFDLKYARWDGDQWQTEAVDTTGNVGLYTSIALDDQGYPHISYYDASPANKNLKYARWTGDDWAIETVDNGTDVGLWTSLALDSDGRPHIAYRDEDNTDLKYAKWTGSSWDIETVDSEGNKGEYASLALDSQDRPHIAYCHEYYDYVFTYHNLRYASWTGSSWDLQTVDDPYYLELGEWASLALNDQDHAHISCYEGGSNLDLKYCKWMGSAWEFETVDGGAPYVGKYTSIALDTLDNPHISYYDFSDNDLKYAWFGDPVIDINLIFFRADTAAGSTIVLTWEVEGDVAGFNLHRSTGSGAEKAVASCDKLNAELIIGEPPYSYLDTAVDEGVTYTYWLEAIDIGGSSETFGPVEYTWNGALPTTYALYQSRPNPTAGTATITFDLPEDAEVTLTVYDISGRKVTTLVDETLPAGEHNAGISGLTPGVYVYKLNAGSFSATKKMVIIE